MKVLINGLSVKKKVGGVFQISTNFIQATLSSKEIEWYYLVSSDLDKSLPTCFQNKLNITYFVMPTQPDFFGSYFNVRKKVSDIENTIKPDLVYSLAAPSYFNFKATEVMRFTNPWVTHPNKYAHGVLNYKEKIVKYLYCANQKRLMKKCDYFITQSNTAKEGIRGITKLPLENIKVVPNVLPAYFNSLPEIKCKSPDLNLMIACVCAPHANKNVQIIPLVIKILKEKYGITNVTFNITIPYDHPFLLKFNKSVEKYLVSDQINNWGYCSQDKLVELYSASNIFFLPTLLETFSASLLEAMFFKLNVVTTDFLFNRGVCQDSAVYCKPADAEDAAEKLSELILNNSYKNKSSQDIPSVLAHFSDYSKHAASIEKFFKSIMNNKL
jgi:glycosyltransferase involved in cell wall biosynthesis